MIDDRQKQKNCPRESGRRQLVIDAQYKVGVHIHGGDRAF